MKHFFKTPLVLLFTVLLTWSCSDDDDNGTDDPMTPPEEEQNIVETATANGLSSLLAAVSAADMSPNNDLATTLSGEGPFTVLAPTNAAFDDLFDRLDGFSSLDDFDTTEEQDLLAAILLYHVVSGAAVTSDQLTNGQSVATAQGGNLTVSTEGGVFFTDAANESAQVTTPDVSASNGVVHVIDKVLLPQAAIDALNDVLLFSITDLAISNTNLSSLVAALQAADGDLPNVLRGDGPFTVLAPTNDAFESFLDGTPLGDVPTEVLTQVLLNHVIAGEIESSTLVAAGTGYASTLASGPIDGSFLSIFYDATDDVEFNGESSVVDGGADIKAINGVVHVVDEVIDLPNIVDHALANDEFDDLVDALTDEGNMVDFVSVLSGTDEVYTVFAPVNAAFDAFMNPDSNPLQDILLNHVISGTAALSTSLSTGYDNTTMAAFDTDENLSLYINTDDGVVLNGVSTVAVPDVVATNGIIHAVDAVIDLPTVVTFAVADPTFDSLQAALTAEGQPDFVGTLSTDGPFTVFAPTNDAFQALLDSNDMWNGLGDIDSGLLTSVLQHHVITPGNIRSGDLTDGISTETLEGDNITINLPGTGENIADVTDGAGNDDIGIIVVDVQANNGVIHAINKVMIPDTGN